MDADAKLLSSRRNRWATAGALAILALLTFYLRAGLDLADRRIGVTYELADSGIELLGVTAGEPAERAGIRAGDLLLSIDGQPLRTGADFDRVALGLHRDIPARVEVQRQGARLQFVVVPGARFDWRSYLVNAVACLLYLGVGLLASRQRVDDLRSTLLSAFCFAVAFELALPIELSLSSGANLAVTVVFLMLTGVQFGLDLHLSTVLPSPPEWLERKQWLIRTFYTVGLSVGLFAAATAIGVALEVESAQAISPQVDEFVFIWFLAIWSLAVTGIIGTRAFTYPDPRGRQQAGLVLLGILPWVGVVWYDMLNPILRPGAEPVSDTIWSFSLLAYPVAVFVAIYLYQLFDLELLVRKSFLYGGLTSLLVLGFYVLVGGIGSIFAGDFGDEGVPLWVLSTAGLTMGLLFNPLRTRLKRFIDRRLFPERQALRSRLVALAAQLPAQGKLPRMGDHLARELQRIFAVEAVAVWISAPPQGQLVELAQTHESETDLERTALISAEDPAIQLLLRSDRPTAASSLIALSPALASRLGEEMRTGLLVPLVAQRRLIGLIALGKKRESVRWVAEELELLSLVGHHAATVFENARLFDSATFEGLTGLYRREALLEILDREWSRSQRYGRPLALAIVDLDHFKKVNDLHGHLTGDLVLQRVAAEMRSLLRETDFIGRYGGEEFLMVLPETSTAGAVNLAEKARERIEQMEVPSESGRGVRVTISIGVASREQVREDDRARSRALIAAADQALYEAKNKGRNRVEAAPAR